MNRVTLILISGFLIGMLPFWAPYVGFDLIGWLEHTFQFTHAHAERSAYKLSAVLAFVCWGVLFLRQKE